MPFTTANSCPSAETLYGISVGMIPSNSFCRQDLGFPLEAHKAVRVSGHRGGQDFDRDFTIELGVPRTVHLTHSARSDGGKDFVEPQTSSGGKGHG